MILTVSNEFLRNHLAFLFRCEDVHIYLPNLALIIMGNPDEVETDRIHHGD